MSARPAIIYTLVFLVLLPIFIIGRRAERFAPELIATQESLLKLGAIDSITVTRGAEKLEFRKTPDGKLYQVVEPPGKFIPQDLMTSTVNLLLHEHSVEVVSQNSRDLSEFGLVHPKTRMTIRAPGRPKPIEIDFGAENPVETAVYAKIEGVPKVFLMGRDLEYYQELMFEWIEGKQGKKA
ncbi:MAG: DUF4340 domain-containing protein [Candidatus Binataceae bacterium]